MPCGSLHGNFFCNFGFAEDTFTQKSSNVFGFSFVYSYLCTDFQSVRFVMYKKLALLVIAVFFSIGKTCAQEKPIAEVFCGAELSYADVNFLRLYNVLLRLTPGTKINLGNEWEVAVQTYLPIINDGYPYRDDMLRLNMANISKVFCFDDARQYFKLTAGLFGNERDVFGQRILADRDDVAFADAQRDAAAGFARLRLRVHPVGGFRG